MFNKHIKIVLAITVFVLSIQQFVDGAVGSTGNGIMLILLSLLFVLLYFKNEILILAFFQLRKQNLVGADKWLNRIKNPQTALTTKQQGYYNYLKGLIISQENMNQAEIRKLINLYLIKHARAINPSKEVIFLPSS